MGRAVPFPLGGHASQSDVCVKAPGAPCAVTLSRVSEKLAPKPERVGEVLSLPLSLLRHLGVWTLAVPGAGHGGLLSLPPHTTRLPAGWGASPNPRLQGQKCGI